MTLPSFDIKPIAAALIVAGLLSACGGGGNNDQTNSQPSSGNQPASGNQSTSTSGNQSTSESPINSTGGSQQTGNNSGASSGGTSTAMACVDGANYQCSGENIVGTPGKVAEVALTDFGVQAYGKATSDLGKTVFTKEEAPNASGLVPDSAGPDSGGITQVRLAKDGNGAVTRVVLVLKNLGMPWDGTKDRPPIIETFDPTQGRLKFGDKNAIITDAFHESSDTTFYDFATKGTGGTQSNYANNRYFPRKNNPPRCGTTTFTTPCPSADPTMETDGKLNYHAGDWRTAGGNQPDTLDALRFHEDGDVHAGDATDGNWLAEGSGHGVPFPGSKGYRTYKGLSYRYANLGAWFTADTVYIAEWTGKDGSREHSTNRRGVVAFGALTNPAIIPTTGTVTYVGRIHGRYASAKDADVAPIDGTGKIEVDFAKRTATITVQPDSGPASVAFTASTTFGATGTNSMNGTVDNGKLSGNVSGRFFGPLAGTGVQAPAETGGAFALKNGTTGEAFVGGFIARKQ